MVENFVRGQPVWCKPRLVDEPITGIYVERMPRDKVAEGYRDGHHVSIHGKIVWVRLDL